MQVLVVAAGGALGNVKAPFYTDLVSIGILGGMLLLFASATYLQLQLAGNVGGNVVLQGSDIGSFALVLLTPDLRAVAHIDHLGFHVERAPMLRKTAYNYTSYLQLSPAPPPTLLS